MFLLGNMFFFWMPTRNGIRKVCMEQGTLKEGSLDFSASVYLSRQSIEEAVSSINQYYITTRYDKVGIQLPGWLAAVAGPYS
jgi:hypothetical protein